MWVFSGGISLILSFLTSPLVILLLVFNLHFLACFILFSLFHPCPVSLSFPLPILLSDLSLLLSPSLSFGFSLDLDVSPTISFFVFHFQLLYTGKVSEDTSPGHFILKVSATDLDSDTNAQITYSLHGPGADEFKLDPHTGGFPELQDQTKNLLMNNSAQYHARFLGEETGIHLSIYPFTQQTYWHHVPSIVLDGGDVINRQIRTGSVGKVVIESVV